MPKSQWSLPLSMCNHGTVKQLGHVPQNRAQPSLELLPKFSVVVLCPHRPLKPHFLLSAPNLVRSSCAQLALWPSPAPGLSEPKAPSSRGACAQKCASHGSFWVSRRSPGNSQLGNCGRESGKRARSPSPGLCAAATRKTRMHGNPLGA